MESHTRISACGLFLGKAGILTALDTICLLHDLTGDNNSKILLVYHTNTHISSAILCPSGSAGIQHAFYFTEDIVLCSFVSCPCLLSLPNGFSFSGG